MIICTRCKKAKYPEDFGRAKWRPEGINTRCKACIAELGRDWTRKNPEAVRDRFKKSYTKWREKNPKIIREALVTEDGRLCRSCNTRKPETEFGRDARSKNLRAWKCKPCARKAHRDWTENNREHVRDMSRGSARAARVRDPQKTLLQTRRYRLKKKYGLSIDAANSMLEDQGRGCKICHVPISFDGKRWTAFVDHCHKTGKTRSLLCVNCNSGLGKFMDNPTLLASAMEYLDLHS